MSAWSVGASLVVANWTRDLFVCQLAISLYNTTLYFVPPKKKVYDLLSISVNRNSGLANWLHEADYITLAWKMCSFTSCIILAAACISSLGSVGWDSRVSL